MTLHQLYTLINPYGAYTVSQTRDLMIEHAAPLSARKLTSIKKFSVDTEAACRTDAAHVLCPRCLSHHRIMENPDRLCNRCRILCYGH